MQVKSIVRTIFITIILFCIVYHFSSGNKLLGGLYWSGLFLICSILRRIILKQKAHYNGNTARGIINYTDIDYMDGHSFEYWCADVLRHNGFYRVEVTQGSGDQGVDIVAYKDGNSYAIQCKRFNKKLGNTPVQEVNTGRAIYKCDRAAVMTNNFFTQSAIEAANATGVELWDRNSLIEMCKNI